jgi:hypothetical protein
MLSVLALIAIAVGMLLCVGSVVSLWIDARKQEIKGEDWSYTDVE